MERKVLDYDEVQQVVSEISGKKVKRGEVLGALDNVEILEVLYKLVDKKSDEIIWESRINSITTKTVIDGLMGMTRNRLAKEATLKGNSEKLINEMVEIKLPKE